METKEIIAIGGTGQELAYAYLKCARLYGFRPVQINVVDAEQSGKMIQELRNQGVRALDPYPYKKEDLGPFKTIFPGHSREEFQKVLNACFTHKEQQVPVREGMMGMAHVGGTSIGAKMILAKDTKAMAKQQEGEDATIEFVNSLKSNGKYLVCGSAVGGTGSGGVPAMARYLRDALPGQRQVLGLVMLRWFYFLNPPAPGLKFAMDDSGLMVNAISSMYYYQAQYENLFDALYLYGEPDFPYPMEHLGNTNKVESLEFFPFMLLAVTMHNSFSQKKSNISTIEIFWKYKSPLNWESPHLAVQEEGRTITLKEAIQKRTLEIRLNQLFLRALAKDLHHLRKFIKPYLPANFHKKMKDLGASEENTLPYRELIQLFTKHIKSLQDLLGWIDQIRKNDPDKNFFDLPLADEFLPHTSEVEALRKDPTLLFEVEFKNLEGFNTVHELALELQANLHKVVERAGKTAFQNFFFASKSTTPISQISVSLAEYTESWYKNQKTARASEKTFEGILSPKFPVLSPQSLKNPGRDGWVTVTRHEIRDHLPIFWVKTHGIPSVWASALLFNWHLNCDHDDHTIDRSTHQSQAKLYETAKTQLLALLKGVFLNVLHLQKVSYRNIGLFGDLMVQEEQRVNQDIAILSFEELNALTDGRSIIHYVGATYSQSLVYPSPQLTEEVLLKLEAKNQERWDEYERQYPHLEQLFCYWLQEDLLSYYEPTPNKKPPILKEGMKAFDDCSLPFKKALQQYIAEHMKVSRPESMARLTTPCYNFRLRSNGYQTEWQATLVKFDPKGHDLHCKRCGKTIAFHEKALELSIDNLSLCCPVHKDEEILDLSQPKNYKGFCIAKDEYHVPTLYLWEDALEQELLPGCIRKERIPGTDSIVYFLSNLRLTLTGKVIKTDDIICKNLIGLRDKNKVLLRPDLPIPFQFQALIEEELCQYEEIPINVKTIKWQGKFRGLKEVRSKQIAYDTRAAMDSIQASLLIWPEAKVQWDSNKEHEPAPFWHRSYLAWTHDRKELEALQLRVHYKVKEASSELRAYKQLKAFQAITLDEEILALEIVDEEQHSYGYFLDQRPLFEFKNKNRVVVAVDFGGTASQAASHPENRDSMPLPPDMVKLRDHTLDILNNGHGYSRLHQEGKYLPTYRLPSERSLPFLASRLWVHSETITLRDGRHTERRSDTETLHFIDHPLADPELNATESTLLEHFNDHLKSDLRGLAEPYLEQFLYLVLWEVLVQHKSSSRHMSLTATYPFGFGTTFRDKYIIFFENVCRRVSENTGMDISLNSRDLISDSMAGLSALTGKHPQSVEVVIDLGGETTDICIYDNRKSKIVMVDSLRFAGNDLLRSLLAPNSKACPHTIEDRVRPASNGNGAPSSDSPSQQNQLIARRISYFNRTINSPLNYSSVSSEILEFLQASAPARAKILRFSRLLLTYVGLNLRYHLQDSRKEEQTPANESSTQAEASENESSTQAEASEIEVQIILTGNGWKLIECALESKSVESDVCKFLKSMYLDTVQDHNLFSKIKFHIEEEAQYFQRKFLTVVGAIKSHSITPEYQVDKNHKGKLYQGYLCAQLKVHQEKGKSKNLPETERIPLDIPSLNKDLEILSFANQQYLKLETHPQYHEWKKKVNKWLMNVDISPNTVTQKENSDRVTTLLHRSPFAGLLEACGVEILDQEGL